MLEQKRFQKRIGICFLTFAVLCEVLVNLSYERGVLAVEHYVGPVVFAFVGMMLFGGRVKPNRDEWMALAYPVWYLLSRLLLRELYLDDSFYNFCSLCLVYAMGFPFARWMNDETRKTGLCAAALLFAGACGILAWIGVYAAVSGQTVVLPYLGTTFAMEGKRLGMSTHANVTACIFFSAFVLDVWLAAHVRKRWIILPAAVLGLGLYLAIGLTDSRTVMVQVSALAAAVVFFGCQKLRISHKLVRYGVAFVAAAATLVIVFSSFPVMLNGLNTVTESILPQAMAEAADGSAKVQDPLSAGRPLLNDLSTLTGRDAHYKGVIRLIKDHPDVLLRGTRGSGSDLSMVMHYLGGVNTHNSYLQVLVNVGVVGLLIAVWFTIRAFWTAVRVVFCLEKRTTFADKLLAVAPLLLLINAITESYVFTELTPYYTFIFFLMLGYAIAHERTLRA